jgi:hypothetical protein
MQDIGNAISKYLFPALLVILGLLLLVTSTGQNSLFKIGGVAIMLVGAVSGFYVKGLINKNQSMIIGIVVGLGSVFFAYMDYTVINEKLEYAKKEQRISMHVIQRLKDIRKAQIAYLKENGKYASSFDSLTYFLKEGKISLVMKLGALPDSVPTDEMARELGLISLRPEGWSDEQVVAAGLIVRDTVQVEVLGYIFNDSDRRSRKTPFFVDSLWKVPFANHKFEMKADIVEISGVKQPLFKAWDPQPFAKQYEVGSLTENSTAGNWNE